MTTTITRSTGISPGVPWAGPLPGGGYQGKTNRLDRAVARFAAWLQRHFDCPVEIRFNSHRLSGGAFVYPGAKGKMTFDTPEIGLGAGLITPPDVRKRRNKILTLRPLEWEDCWTEDTPLDYDVLICPAFLRDPSDLGEHKPNAPFGYWTVATPQVATPQEAYHLLRKLVKEGVIKG